jgi:hypothetical protein
LITLDKILFGNFMTACIFSFVPSNVIHCRKVMENSYVVKFFSEGRKNYWTRSYLSNGKNHKLWYAPWYPLDISNSWFAYSSNFVFWAPFYFCIQFLGF